jgi:beta-mannosidase
MADLRETRELCDGWEFAQTNPGEFRDATGLDELDWRPALVPGTVASVVEQLTVDPDAFDWWFRKRFDASPLGLDEQLVLRFDGIATIAEVFLNGTPILNSRSMFAAHEVDVSHLATESNELVLCCRALEPELRVQRRPRARWRTALVDGNLRFFRTMLLGRAPGFAPGPAVVGPWRPVSILRSRAVVVSNLGLRTRVEGDCKGVLAVHLTARRLGSAPPPDEITVTIGSARRSEEFLIPLTFEGGQLIANAELRLGSVQKWWPHTHGDPSLYDVTISVAGEPLHRDRVGFRRLEWPSDWEDAGLALRINDEDVFARGAVWTPLDMLAPHRPQAELRVALEQVRDAGMNMLRIPGIGCYESDGFYDLCDELGILVWQDFMLANLDYPAEDPAWAAEFEEEVRQVLGRLGGRPSTAVLCGGSEVAQQVAMLGLDPALARGELYTETLPHLIEEAEVAIPYVPNSPWGGTLPFRPDRGVANYYGVGAYLRDLSDVRLAEVKFAGECLAFSNVPDDATLEQIDAPAGLTPHSPAWKRGVPRDAGAGWDFEDVRDHYLGLLYRETPTQLRWYDLPRYLELSRFVTGEVMAEVYGEWRRAASPCNGGLTLWMKDLMPGAGWGIIDQTGRPKVAYHLLRRALAPVTVWLTDEGLSGMVVHVVNEGPEPLEANLRIALYRDLQLPVEQANLSVSVPAHRSLAYDVESLLGRFVDLSFAYRFGPPGHDTVVASLERAAGPGVGLIANAFRFPLGRPTTRETAEQLGVTATLRSTDNGPSLTLRSDRLVYGVRVDAPGFAPEDDALTLEPGVERILRLRGEGSIDGVETAVHVTAINMTGRLRVTSG